MGSVKVLADKQTDGWTDRPKTTCPQSIDAGA